MYLNPLLNISHSTIVNIYIIMIYKLLMHIKINLYSKFMILKIIFSNSIVSLPKFYFKGNVFISNSFRNYHNWLFKYDNKYQN